MESHNAMRYTSSCSGHCWLYILLIVLGGVIPGLPRVVCAQAQTPPPAPQADPDNAEHVALGQQVYASFCTGCHGVNLEGQPNWRQRLPLGTFLPRHTMRAVTPGIMPTSGCLNSSSTGANTMPRRAIAAPCRRIRRCSPMPRSGPCWPLSKAAGQPPSGRSRRSRMLVIAKGVRPGLEWGTTTL